MLTIRLDARRRWHIPVSELDETAALPSRNLHINQLSELPKHVPQVLVAYGWIQTSNKYLPTVSIPTAHHSDIHLFFILTRPTTMSSHRLNNTPPHVKFKGLNRNALVNSPLCCSDRCLSEMPAEMAAPRKPYTWQQLRERLHPRNQPSHRCSQ